MAKQNRWQQPWQSELWDSDEEFELLLQQSLSAIQPPADFSNRVMAAVHQEAAAAKVVPLVPAKKRRFAPSLWPGVGAIAASLALFLWAALALPGDNAEAPGALPGIGGNVQVAATNPLPKPQLPELAPKQNADAQPTAEQTANANQTEEPTGQAEQLPRTAEQPVDNQTPGNANQPSPAPQPVNADEPTGLAAPESNESGAGELILPRAAFGTEAQGTLSVRLLAEVPESQIYTPAINRRGSMASFYTVDEENVYSWRVSLSTADSPEVTLVTSRSSIDDMGSMLAKTTEPCDATTLVSSPDNTIIAQNSPDGLWISLAEGEVYSLSEEAGGSLLAWSPDSSKLLFTNSQGQLFMGYPLEKRIYQITDMFVEDVCWSTDNQTIIFLATNNGQSALYIAELI